MRAGLQQLYALMSDADVISVAVTTTRGMQAAPATKALAVEMILKWEESGEKALKRTKVKVAVLRNFLVELRAAGHPIPGSIPAMPKVDMVRGLLSLWCPPSLAVAVAGNGAGGGGAAAAGGGGGGGGAAPAALANGPGPVMAVAHAFLLQLDHTNMAPHLFHHACILQLAVDGVPQPNYHGPVSSTCTPLWDSNLLRTWLWRQFHRLTATHGQQCPPRPPVLSKMYLSADVCMLVVACYENHQASSSAGSHDGADQR